MRIALLVLALALAAPASAAPSTFPETAVSFQVGYQQSIAFGLGAEVLLPVRYLDVSVGADAVIETAGDFGVRVFSTALLFPTVGTVPPLALGTGIDVTYRDDAVAAHLGVVIGSDLLFVSDLPATLSLYLAPGFAFGHGFSLAWHFEARYYFDEFALVLSSSDLTLMALGVRMPF